MGRANIKIFVLPRDIIRDKVCIYCLEKIETGCVSCSTCRVIGHVECYARWCKKKKRTPCPLCRKFGTTHSSSLNNEYKQDKHAKLLIVKICRFIFC